jgi:hypothetical protein
MKLLLAQKCNINETFSLFVNSVILHSFSLSLYYLNVLSLMTLQVFIKHIVYNLKNTYLREQYFNKKPDPYWRLMDTKVLFCNIINVQYTDCSEQT